MTFKTGWLAETGGTGNAPTEKLDVEPAPIKLGQWYEVSTDGEGKAWLGCVTTLGSNYAELTGRNGKHQRVHLGRFDAWCTLRDDDTARRRIAANVERHRLKAGKFLEEIKQLTTSLGVGPRDALSTQSEVPQTALAHVSGTVDVNAHKQALIKAKTETLPALFEKVREEHEAMASWMRMEMLPAEAQLKAAERVTGGIEDKIFTVELYAGLIEQVIQIADGAPAGIDDKIHLFQRRHYMDEECLVNYEAGGMDFRSIEKFDAWLARPSNRDRILPKPRCIVAFRVRRFEKERDWPGSMSAFIQLMNERDADKQTFLYIRNGDQIFRLTTGIDFGGQLFPDREHNELLLGGDQWVEPGGDVISGREYEGMRETYRAKEEAHHEAVRAWKRDGKKGRRPTNNWNRDGSRAYRPLKPNSVYYDDGMKTIAEAARSHNRVAVVLQGLLDRSPALHPHPPWRLWTPEGFNLAIDLVYDDSRGLVDGPAPDFEAYRAKLNESLRKGSYTIGQEDVWLQHEREKEQDRRDRSMRDYRGSDVSRYYRPYGNPGPGLVAQVTKMSRAGACTFEWWRERQRDRCGDRSDLRSRFTCDSAHLLNVSAYKAGDFKVFFADPRTRANYLEWAPMLLAAEDWVARGGDRDSETD